MDKKREKTSISKKIYERKNYNNLNYQNEKMKKKTFFYKKIIKTSVSKNENELKRIDIPKKGRDTDREREKQKKIAVLVS